MAFKVLEWHVQSYQWENPPWSCSGPQNVNYSIIWLLMVSNKELMHIVWTTWTQLFSYLIFFNLFNSECRLITIGHLGKITCLPGGWPRPSTVPMTMAMHSRWVKLVLGTPGSIVFAFVGSLSSSKSRKARRMLGFSEWTLLRRKGHRIMPPVTAVRG